MSGYWYPPDDHQLEPAQFTGSAHSVSSDPSPEDRAEQVRKVAEEVTGKPMPRPTPRRIGF